ncbi:serine/threonine-protein phosphatase 7 long form homolog [Gastrolobium bilobum]|uniref:serine/threonine-protein phosphatase 7 long form homolog n=1 Tax=Gastrolobium bilobum TaxID=150636 RepID=UPI002AAFF596|nr:serine/threonine-protein phosphatase 7 long form homolog [Gastrolobium bilobum]
MTITLQDVAGILGLPTDGIVVTGSTNEDWPAVCVVVFGAVPQANEFHHSGDHRISFLDQLYTRWTDHAGDHDREIYFTKAHIARMPGCWLLADKSGGSNIGCRLVLLLGGGFDEIGRFSWGSAVLAHLFRNLFECTDVGRSDMGGCHILLQIWAWIRFSPIAPPLPPHPEPGTHYGYRFNTVAKFKPHEVVHYRATMDTLCRDEVVWQPYIDYQWPDVTPHQQYLWLAVTPLIYFHIIEACQPDRCMRQFGLDQPILDVSRKLRGIHDHTLQGKVDENWRRKLRPWIERWQVREQHIVVPPPLLGLMSPNHAYMEWYRAKGKRYISLRATKIGRMIDGLEMLYHVTTTEEFPCFGLDYIHEEIGRIIGMFRENSRVDEPGPEAPPVQTQPDPQLSLKVPRNRQEGRGLGHTRERVTAVPVPIMAPRPMVETQGWFRPPVIGTTYGSQPMYHNRSQDAGGPSQPESDHLYMDSQEPVF